MLKRKEISGKVTNIGNPNEITIIEVARTVLDLTGSKSKLAFVKRGEDDPQRRCPDINRARSLLDWEPTTSLIEGLRRTILWVKSFIDKPMLEPR
jgi:nucleoside-diphosphate-sugar epimerase